MQLHLQQKEQTSFEAKAFVLYKALHHDLWNLEMHWNNCVQKAREQTNLMGHCEAAHAAVEAETMRYGNLSGHPDGGSSLLPNEGEYTLKPAHLQELLNNLTTCIEDYNRHNAILWEMYKEGNKLEEAFDASFINFSKAYFSPIIASYETVQVDTISLDRDFDKFRECCTAVSDLRESFIEQLEALKPAEQLMQNNVHALNRHRAYLSKSLDLLNPDIFSHQVADLN